MTASIIPFARPVKHVDDRLFCTICANKGVQSELVPHRVWGAPHQVEHSCGECGWEG